MKINDLKKWKNRIFVLTAILILILPSIEAVTTETVLSEDFEGAFPGSWTVGDSNSNDGYDYWDDTSYKAHLGSWSAWSADIGSQTETFQVFTEDAESSFPADNWLVGDSNSNSGEDYWDDLSCRFHWGSWSLWSADIGDQSDCVNYDNDMQAYMIRKYLTNASSWDTATLTYYAWYDVETDYDYLQVMVTGNGGANWYLIGDKLDGSSGWGYHSVSIPSQYLTSQFSIGFYFYSDDSVTYEGVYVDDVTLTATKTTSNSQLHKYDDNMDAYMRRTVNLTDYTSASIEFWHLMPTVEGGSYDYGQFKVNGVEVERYDAAVTSWTKETIDLSSYVGGTATLEWNFHSDSSVRYEGWYIDDIKVEGVLPGEITVKGYLFFNAYDTTWCGSTWCPAKWATIWVYDEEVGTDEYLGSVLTDTSGYFEFGPIDNDDGFLQGGRDIYLRIIATNSANEVVNSGENWYDGYTDTKEDVPDGDVDFENLGTPVGEHGAWEIFDTLNDGWNYYANNFSYDHGKVTTIWYPNSTDGTYVEVADGYRMHIIDGDQMDEDVLLHEYGHSIMFGIYGAFPPTPNCNPHYFNLPSSLGCAWSEGWATYSQAALQNDKIYSDTVDQWITNDLEAPTYNGDSFTEADDVEGAIAAVLWDIYDSVDDGLDTFSNGPYNIFDVFRNYIIGGHHVYDIYEFWDGWFARGHNQRIKMNNIFWYHGIDMNDNPTVTSLDQTPTSLYRTQTFKIYAHYSDTETSEGSLMSIIEYQRPANDGWNSCTEYWDSGNHRWYCDITTGTNDNQLGTWDFRTNVSDSMEGSGWTYDYNTVTVSNNNPSVSGIPDKDTDEDTTPPDNWIDLYNYASDTEDGDSSMAYAIISETNSALIDCSIDSNRYVDCGTPAQNQYGSSDITIQVDDTDGGSDTDTFRVTVNSVNDPPTVTLESPPDNNVSTTGNITFNCSATDDINLQNITLYINISGTFSANETKIITGTANSTTFTINNIPDNTNFIWNCLAYDNNGLSDWGDSNRSIVVDYIAYIADEIEGRAAIENGINNALNNSSIFTDQQIYLRYWDNTQKTGMFDKVAKEGNQRWAFNYVTEGESFTNIGSLGTTVNILELTNRTATNITTEIEAFIIQTKW